MFEPERKARDAMNYVRSKTSDLWRDSFFSVKRPLQQRAGLCFDFVTKQSKRLNAINNVTIGVC